MTWFHWVLIVIFAIEAIGNVVIIGQPRKPMKPETAAFNVLCYGLLIWGVVAFA